MSNLLKIMPILNLSLYCPNTDLAFKCLISQNLARSCTVVQTFYFNLVIVYLLFLLELHSILWGVDRSTASVKIVLFLQP